MFPKHIPLKACKVLYSPLLKIGMSRLCFRAFDPYSLASTLTPWCFQIWQIFWGKVQPCVCGRLYSCKTLCSEYWETKGDFSSLYRSFLVFLSFQIQTLYWAGGSSSHLGLLKFINCHASTPQLLKLCWFSLFPSKALLLGQTWSSACAKD